MRDDVSPEVLSGSGACAHCGLPVTALRRPGDGPLGPAYCCVGCRLAAAASGGQGETKFLEARLLLAAFLAMGCMEFSLVLYGDSLFHARADDATGAVRGFGRIALVAFSLPVLLLLAPPLLRGAWQDLRAWRVRTDGLVVLAIGAAWALSVAHSIRGTGEVYFETATMLLVLFAFGRRLEAHARTRGRDAAKSVLESLPDTARRVAETGEEESVPHDALRAGDRVRVAPGEGVPADVVVEEGRSEVRAAHVTGESAPRAVAPGDEVPAGAVNGTGALTARVLRPSSEGTIGRILSLLDAPLPPTRTTRMIDRLAVWLTAVAVVAAALGGWRSHVSGGWGAACTTALSVLVVACPCALGLATPLAYRAIRAALARQGVLVRDPAALEVAATVDRVLLDKTGTLTDAAAGRLELEAGDAAAFGRMSALVRHSGHALAHTVAAAAVPAPAELVAVPGAGVTGVLDGVEGRAGSPDWMDREGMAWDGEVESRRRALDAHGVTLVAYAESGRVTALGAVRQELRPGAAEAVAALRAQGLRVEILSGDRHGAVEEVAGALGAEWSAALRPEDKVARVRALQAEGGRVLTAGDGANDAPALRASDVGVAMACGTAAARSQAQVDVLGSSLAVLPSLTLASRALRRTVRGNLVWNVVYNTAALTLAATGNLHPLVAVAAMIASSLTVSARSYRLLEWRSEPSASGGEAPLAFAGAPDR